MSARPPVPWSRIVRRDYAAFVLFLLPLVFWGLFLFVAVTGFLPRGPEARTVPPAFFPLMAAVDAALTLVLGTLFVRRVRGIRRILETGTECEAVVTSASFFRDRGRVEFTYEVGGKPYRSGCAVFKTPATRALGEGDRLTIVVDPERPDRALLPSVFA